MSTFTFDDHQPILYALILWIVTRLWMSPAMVAIVQIIGLSSAVGYAFYRLEKIGVPKQWIVVAVFAAAVLPANAFFMVTLWKDVLYAILYVWLTVFMLELYISKGMWIIQKKNMVLLAGVIIFVTLLRYNGFIEMTLLLFSLFLFYKRFWRRWIIIGVVAFSVMTTANYTFDQFLPKTENPMRKTTEGAFARILEARIKAHIYSGTELQQRERSLLSKTMPSLAVLKRYNCHVSLPPNFYHSDMLFDPDNRDELVSTYLAFATRSPWVEVRHQICNLSILWRVYPREGETKELVPVKVRSWSNELIYQVTPALAELHGISQESKRPQLARSLGEYMGDMVRDDSLHVALWRVAPFAYIIVIGLVFRAVAYDKDIRVLVLGSPAIAHLAIFTFGNLYEDFRFHYMILPIACILWPLLFLRGRIHKPDEE
jgi:hypothetical protein